MISLRVYFEEPGKKIKLAFVLEPAYMQLKSITAVI
jgi:hypothetical protein